MPGRKHLALAAVASLAFPAAALAQTLDPAALHELDDDRSDITYENLTVDQIEDRDLVHEGTEIGEIEEVLANDQDEIVAVVVEYDQGFLDLGGTEVVMPIEQLEFGDDQRQVATVMSQEDLEALPVWDD